MKKVLVISTLAALIVGPATAADLARPVYRRPVAVFAPVYNWTGFYIGLNAGAAIGHASQDPAFSAPECDVAPTCPQVIGFFSTGQSMNSTTFTGGGQAGVNYQLGRFVVGAEADIEYMRLRGSFASRAAFPGPMFPDRFNTPSSSGSISTDWLVTVRPRIGWAFDRLLVYGTGGVAFTNRNDSLSDIDSTTTQGVIGVLTASPSSRHVGWVAGGGLEYAFSNSLSAKAEYLHLDFGDITEQAGVVGGIGGMEGASVIFTSHLTADIVRAGLNYKFGYAAAPAVYK
jgi:outer membrane immunogenic protein